MGWGPRIRVKGKGGANRGESSGLVGTVSTVSAVNRGLCGFHDARCLQINELPSRRMRL